MTQQPASSGNQPSSPWTAGHTAVLSKKEEKGLGGKEDPEPRGIVHCQGVGRRNSAQGRAQGRRRAREESGERPRRR